MENKYTVAELNPMEFHKSIATVEQNLCAYNRLSYEAIYSQTRKWEILDCRKVITYYLHKYLKWNIARIARYFHQDRSSMYNNLEKFCSQYQTEEAFRKMANAVLIVPNWVNEDVELSLLN